jgi:FdhD protein
MKKMNRYEPTDELALKGAAQEINFHHFSGKKWERASVHLPSEMPLTIFVNSQELVTILCTPTKLNGLVMGFLYAEGIISGMEDVASMKVCEEESLADVTLKDTRHELPTKRTLTSGCGGGATFGPKGKKVDSDLAPTPKELLSLMRQLQEQMLLHRHCGGVHASALSDNKALLVVAEDIGRHNTLDKIQGECLLKGLRTKDRLLLSTGRISTEMLLKSAKMQVPVVVSRHSPTGSAVSLACELGISLVGHAKGNRLSVYSLPERIKGYRTE